MDHFTGNSTEASFPDPMRHLMDWERDEAKRQLHANPDPEIIRGAGIPMHEDCNINTVPQAHILCVCGWDEPYKKSSECILEDKPSVITLTQKENDCLDLCSEVIKLSEPFLHFLGHLFSLHTPIAHKHTFLSFCIYNDSSIMLKCWLWLLMFSR